MLSAIAFRVMSVSRSPNGADASRATASRIARGFTAFFALLVCLLVVLAVSNPVLFNTWMYEDAWGEWATFYAFALGGATGMLGLARRIRRKVVNSSLSRERAFRCGLFLVSLFCLAAAGEEISWGQRLLGVIPPELFQELNDQQELNVHNILISFVSAQFVVGLICFGYGVALPLAARHKRLQADNQLDSPQPVSRLEMVAPPLVLSPWFALVGVVYLIQPTPLALEADELLLGLLLFADVLLKCRTTESQYGASPWRSARPLVLLSIPLLLGAVTNPLLDRFVFGADENRVAQARAELAAIAWDLRHAGAIYPEIPHQDRLFDNRIFSAVRDDLIRFKDESRFYGARLNADLDDAERKRRSYFLDPWNNPYWICMKGYGPIHLYSFGPNRRLDTLMIFEQRVPTEADMKGDDIAIWVDLYKSTRPGSP